MEPVIAQALAEKIQNLQIELARTRAGLALLAMAVANGDFSVKQGRADTIRVPALVMRAARDTLKGVDYSQTTSGATTYRVNYLEAVDPEPNKGS